MILCEHSGFINGRVWRRGRKIQAIKDDTRNCFVESAAEHSKPTLLIIAPGKTMCEISALSSRRESVEKAVQGGTKPAPCLNSTRCDTSTLGRGVPDVFVMFATDCSSTRNDRSQLCAVGCHRMPDSGVEKEFSGIEGVRGNDVQDALLHLAIFFRAEASGPLITV